MSGLVTLLLVLTGAGFSSHVQAGSNVRFGDQDVLDQRIEAEQASLANPFIITQHRQNYLLVHTTMSNPNQQPYAFLGDNNLLDRQEAKYQISLKAPVYLREEAQGEGIYAALTVKAWWQVYNKEVSKPFRETNYEPEVFYQWNPRKPFGRFELLAIRLGINHQSNGQSTQWSRSWNRTIVEFTAQQKKFFTNLRLWYRWPQSKKDYPNDPTGDDNPDMTRFMGHFELTLGTKIRKTGIAMLLRNNLEKNENRRYTEINVTYPINSRFDWLVQYASGYGESMIDYNHKMRRVGIGFQLLSY